MSAPTRTRLRASADASSRAPSLRYATLLAAVLLLLLTGAVVVLSASAVVSLDHRGQPLSYFWRHLSSVGLAIVVLMVTIGVDYRRWRRLAAPLAGVSALGLVAVLAVGDVVHGSRRWLDLGPITVQPSEIAKLALVVSVALFLETRRHELDVSRRVVRPLVLFVGAGCALVLAQPDLGTMTIIALTAAGMMFAAGVPARLLAGLALLAVPLTAVLFMSADYRRARITGFLHPVEERLGAGYQTFQSLVGLANGGITGTGLGNGEAKWGWVPNAHTDFIFVVVGEEMGLTGAAAVLGLLAVVGVLGFRTAQRAPDYFGALLAAGVTVWLMVQTFVNVGGVLGLLPITGVTLPFLSYGSSSLLVNSAAAGLLLNVARQSGQRGEQRTAGDG